MKIDFYINHPEARLGLSRAGDIAKEIVDSIKLKRELSKSTNPIRLSLERNAEYMSENEYIQARAYLDNLEMQRLFDEECIE